MTIEEVKDIPHISDEEKKIISNAKWSGSYSANDIFQEASIFLRMSLRNSKLRLF